MFAIDPVVATVVAAVAGLCIGSFLNVVIHRLPKMLERGWEAQCAELRGETLPPADTYNLIVPRSACPKCGAPITALQNIPVVSWLALGGKCKACKAPISARYPVVEALGGLLAAVAIWRFGPTAQGVAACALLWSLLALTMIDFDTQLLPDGITLPLLWGGLIANLWNTFAPLHDAVIGAVGDGSLPEVSADRGYGEILVCDIAAGRCDPRADGPDEGYRLVPDLDAPN